MVGDRVVIIPGRNSGRNATVTSLGQCQSLRITIDGGNTEICGYSHHQLKRIDEPSDTTIERSSSTPLELNSEAY